MGDEPTRRLAGIYRFTSLPPSKKIYGRLDFLRSERPSRSLLKTQEKRLTINRTLPIDRPIESRTIELPSRNAMSPKQSDTISQHSRTIQARPIEHLVTPLKSVELPLRGKSQTPNPQILPQPKSVQLHHNHTESYHDPVKCVCDHCTCGRHFCKIHTITPSMQIGSQYSKDFPSKSPVARLAFRPAAAEDSTNPTSPTVDMNSQYLKEYLDRYEGKPNRPAPRDSLKFKGPLLSLSSYNNEYPGFHGDNQYVKPTDRHFMQGPALDSLSVYKKQYQNLLPKLNPDSPTIYQDTVKNLDLWLGDSSYRQNYRKPRTNDYTTFRAKMIEKRRIVPEIQSRFQTIYRNEYDEKQTAVCKAKVLLDTMDSQTRLNDKKNRESVVSKYAV